MFYLLTMVDYRNGKTPGITLPSASGQEAVIRKAYAKACLDLQGTRYIECHGTGTAVGDPIEVEGISRVFKQAGKSPILIGSVKSNLGHSEAASGITSIIKTVLVLEQARIPATIGVGTINPKIRTEDLNIDIVTSMQDWPSNTIESALTRRAGVNSFGYGGANAHAIIENSDIHVPPGYGQSAKLCAHLRGGRKSYLIPISATSEASFRARVLDLADYVRRQDVDIVDLAQSLGIRRSHLLHRGFFVCQDRNLHDNLHLDNMTSSSSESASSSTPFAFVFTGQGAQWPEMCKELFQEFPTFRRAISEMEEVLSSLSHPPDWSLEKAILEPAASSMIHDPSISQPACTAIQIGLVNLLTTWGIRPTTVIGHSSGEIAAAYAAGKLTAAKAITVSYYRGLVVGKYNTDGAMMVAGISRTLANSEIESAGLQGKIRVACINSSESVTISGDSCAVDAMLQILQKQKIFARKIITNGRAYHSHHMLALGEEYQLMLDQAFEAVNSYSDSSTNIPWVSTVTGELHSGPIDGSYWRSNLERPVLFADGVKQLAKDNSYHFIEIGPHSAMEMPIKQISSELALNGKDCIYSTAISRGKNSAESLLRLAGRLYLYGNDVSFRKINDPLIGSSKQNFSTSNYAVLHDLPPYRWTYDRMLWNECRASSEFRNRRYTRHELLGSQIPGGNRSDIQWRNLVRLNDIPWMKDHKLNETIVFPGAGYIAMAMEGVTQAENYHIGDKLTYRLRNVNILKALIIPVGPMMEVELFMMMRPNPISSISNSKDWWEFSVVSFDSNISTTRAKGLISVRKLTRSIRRKYKIPVEHLEPTASRVWYEKLIKEGLNFGPAFQSIREFQVPRMKEGSQCTTKVPLLQSWQEDPNGRPPYAIHPITIDAMLQTAIVATTAGVTRDLRAMVPVSIDVASFETPSAIRASESWFIDANAQTVGFGAAEINAELRDNNGRVIAQMNRTRLVSYDATTQIDASERHPMLRVLWKPDLIGLGIMPSEPLTSYLNDFVEEAHSEISDEGLLKLGAVINLLSHKNPSLRVLELANDVDAITEATLGLLHAKAPFKYLSSYTKGFISEDRILHGYPVNPENTSQQPGPLHEIVKQLFDLILLPFVTNADYYLATKLGTIKSVLAPTGCLLALSGSTKDSELPLAECGFEVVQSSLNNGNGRIVLGQPVQVSRLDIIAEIGEIVIVDRGLNVLSQALADELYRIRGRKITRLSLNEVSSSTIPARSSIFCLAESERSLLAEMTDYEMGQIKTITDSAACIVWITSGDLMRGTRPEFGLIQGLSRAIMIEQPSLKFYTYDIDDISIEPYRTASNLLAVLTQTCDSIADFEFIQKDGIAHISRFTPDDILNEIFRIKQGSKAIQKPLAKARPVQLHIDRAGQFDTIHFKQIELPKGLEPHQVQIKVKAIGLNAKDFYVLGGKVDTTNATCTLEYCGIVEKIGNAVRNLTCGDRVVVMAPGHFRTNETVPDWACQKLENHEDFNVMSTLPVVYSTALYALHERARIQAGESVLIHSGAGGVGIAAIQIAQQAGAEASNPKLGNLLPLTVHRSLPPSRLLKRRIIL